MSKDSKPIQSDTRIIVDLTVPYPRHVSEEDASLVIGSAFATIVKAMNDMMSQIETSKVTAEVIEYHLSDLTSEQKERVRATMEAFSWNVLMHLAKGMVQAVDSLGPQDFLEKERGH